MKYHYDIIQGTDEWHRLRCGIITAISCPALIMEKKTNKGYQDLVKRIAYERHTGELAESWGGNKWTERGKEFEPLAREAFEFETFQKVTEVGFIGNDKIGCSPDGLIGENGMIEIKCLGWSAHMDLLKSMKVPTDYYNQMQFQLYVSGREYNIFYAWYPHPKIKCLKINITPDLLLFKRIEKALSDIEGDIKNAIKLLNI